jgi:hypothetical protein
MRIPVAGVTNLSESNSFLRAFWAELRLRFGKCDWLYQPFKDGVTRTIFLGFADIGINEPLSVGLKYSQRTVVSEILVNEHGAEEIDKKSELATVLKEAVETALKRYMEPSLFHLKTTVQGLRLPIAFYSGRSFSIRPKSGAQFDVELKVRGYDDIDAKTEAKQRLQYILDIAAVETNHLFWSVPYQVTDETDSSSQDSATSTNSDVEQFVLDEEWIDDAPIASGTFLLSTSGKELISRLVDASELSDSEEKFLRACHHYHVARQQDALLNERLIALEPEEITPSESTLSFKLDARVTGVAQFGMRSQELAIVLYMSAMEVVSLIGAEAPEHCPKCDQNKYKCSARVVDLVTRLTPEAGRDCMVSVFKDHYDKRSKYLHTGLLFTDDAYTGVTIPTLNPGNKSGVSQRSTVLVSNMREWVGYMLRQILKSLVGLRHFLAPKGAENISG